MFVDKLRKIVGYSFTKQANLSTIWEKSKSYPPKIREKKLSTNRKVDKLSTENRGILFVIPPQTRGVEF